MASTPKGTILFSTVGRTEYGFDVFSAKLNPDGPPTEEHRLTDGISINFNAQFIDDDQSSLVFISERTGSPSIYLTRPNLRKSPQLLSSSTSLFVDRPIIKNQHLYFISAHEQPDRLLNSWSALYSTTLKADYNQQQQQDNPQITRLTPYGSVDYSPAISKSGKLIAVASYGSRPWGGEFHELNTDIIVFKPSEPSKRFLVCEHGGWPTWSGDSTIFFHRQADEDKWWSIYQVDIPEMISEPLINASVTRITPPGVHCFTPAAMHDGAKRIAVATRRPCSKYRHIEIFDLESKMFLQVTQMLNPNFHHYNPFVSPDSQFVGYHRFRGDSGRPEEMTIPHLDPVCSPEEGLHMVRLKGNFPAVSQCGGFVACNYAFDTSQNPGVKVIKSDGSKSWMLLKDSVAFYNAWSPTERHVIYTSLGPIFESAKTTVQIGRIEFDPSHLNGEGHGEIPCNVKILTREDAGNNAFPSCSPDGKHLVFRSGRSGHKNLYIIDAVNGELEGGSILQLTNGAWIDTMPSWSPKGDLIAFSSNMHNPNNTEAFGIYVIKPDGSDLKRVHVAGSDDAASRERLNHVCFNKDGEWILFTSNLGGVTTEPVSLPNQFQPYGDLYVMKLDGTGLRRMTWNGYENGTPSWHHCHLDVTTNNNLLQHLGTGEKLSGHFDEPIWIKCD